MAISQQSFQFLQLPHEISTIQLIIYLHAYQHFLFCYICNFGQQLVIHSYLFDKIIITDSNQISQSYNYMQNMQFQQIMLFYCMVISLCITCSVLLPSYSYALNYAGIISSIAYYWPWNKEDHQKIKITNNLTSIPLDHIIQSFSFHSCMDTFEIHF